MVLVYQSGCPRDKLNRGDKDVKVLRRSELFDIGNRFEQLSDEGESIDFDAIVFRL